MHHLSPRQFEDTLLSSPLLRPLLARWSEVDLPDSWLAAGAVAQTVWNAAHGLPHDYGIADIDLVYFDAAELSASAEAVEERRIRRAFADLPVKFDVKNEARVHLWYSEKFGRPVDPYVSTAAAIATFPTTATAVGIRPTALGLEVCAPFGLDDLLNLVVRANKVQVSADRYTAKVARWRALWPRLTVLEWAES